MNQVVLIGRLAQDPHLSYTPEGLAVGEFTLAVGRPRRNDAAEKKEDFIDVVVWRKLAEACGAYLERGRKVAVQGHLEIRKYSKGEETRKAAKVVAWQVQFLERTGDRGKDVS